MSVPRYKARETGAVADDMTSFFDVLDLAADGLVVIAGVPSGIVIDVVEAMNRVYESGVEDGAASERIRQAGRITP